MILANLMTKTSSKLIFGFLAVLVITGLILPGLSYAKFGIGNRNNNAGPNKNANTSNQGNIGNNQGLLCSRITNWMDKISQDINNRENRLQEKRAEREQIMNNRREERDEKLAQIRERWEANREKQYSKLEEKAQTDEQKQAVIEFKQAVDAAIAARKAAIGAAIKTYRDGLDEAIDGRKTAADVAKAAYRNAYQVAVQKAKDDCTAGVDANQIRTTLMASLKAAREAYNSARQAIEQADVKVLVEARQTAFKKALEDFKAAMQTARDALKAAFAETGE